MAQLTREQMTANINALEKQGASQQEIQGWLNSLKSAPIPTQKVVQPTTQPITQPKKEIGGIVGTDIKIAKGILNSPQAILDASKKVIGYLSKNEQILGSDIGQTLSMNIPTKLGGTKGVASQISTQYIDNGKRALQMAKKEVDPTRKAKLVAMAQKNFDQSGATFSQIYPVLDKTDLQIIGDVSAVGVDILSAGSYAKTGASVLKTPVIGFAKGTLQGVGKGALTGLITGSAQGLVGGMQEGYTGKKLLVQTEKQGITGGIIGGALGGIVGGISGKLNAKDIEKQKRAFIAITPKPEELSNEDYLKAADRGFVIPKTKTQPAKVLLTDSEKEMAQTYGNLLQGNDPIRNINSLGRAIDTQDTNIGNKLKLNPVEFTKDNLKWHLTNSVSGIEDLSIPDQSLYKKQRDNLITAFVDGIPDSGDTTGVTNDFNAFVARKSLDQTAKKLGVFRGAPSAKKEILYTMRTSTQDYIKSLRPGDMDYANAMKAETDMIKLTEMVNRKALTEKGLNAISVWIQKNPVAAKTIKWAVGVGAGGYAVKKLIGLETQ